MVSAVKDATWDATWDVTWQETVDVVAVGVGDLLHTILSTAVDDATEVGIDNLVGRMLG